MNIRLIIRENKVKKKTKPYYEPKLDDSAHFVNESDNNISRSVIRVSRIYKSRDGSWSAHGWEEMGEYNDPYEALNNAKQYIGPGYSVVVLGHGRLYYGFDPIKKIMWYRDFRSFNGEDFQEIRFVMKADPEILWDDPKYKDEDGEWHNPSPLVKNVKYSPNESGVY